MQTHRITTERKTTSRPSVSRISTRQTSGETKAWKDYKPHSELWFQQALERYRSEQDKIIAVQQIAKKDPYICFECTNIYHLADYHISSDKTKTFRYCDTCASVIKQAGTDLTLIQKIEEPDEEQPIEEEAPEEKQTSQSGV